MRKLHFAIFGALIIGGLASCQPQSIDTSGNTAATYTANETDIKNYAASINPPLSGTLTSSGLYYVSTLPSSSTVLAAYGQELEFNYTLYVLNGPSNTGNTSSTVVTAALADTAFTKTSVFFPFYTGSLLPGLEEGLLKMHEGEKATMLMPAILAYGSVASTTPPVPANSPVRFDVTLLRARTEDQQINEYITANNLAALGTVETTSTGLRFIRTVTNATGVTPTSGQTITLNYAGKLLRSSAGFAGGTGTDVKTIGVSKYVAGFEEGLAKLKVGEKAIVIFPSSQGYGTVGAAQNGVYVIPPYAPLRFDLEVVSVK